MSAQDVASIEFQNAQRDGLDLHPSVYVLDAENDEMARRLAIRVRSEHSASFLQPPKPAGTVEVDLHGLLEQEPVLFAGTTKFRFANSTHAELRLSDHDAVVRLVQAVLDQLQERAIRISLHEIMEYIDARLVANDPEWIAVIGSPGAETGAWGQAIAAFRRSRSRGNGPLSGSAST